MRKFVAVLVVAIALAGVERASAQALDLAPAKDAINRLKQMPASIKNVQTVIGQTNFGPFEIHDSCCARRFIFCVQTWNWWYKFPNYVWLKDNLQARYANISSTAGQFDSRFAPVRGWLLQTVPYLSTRFGETAARLGNLQQRIGDPSTPAVVKTLLEREAVMEIESLNGDLQRGTQQLRDGISGVSNMDQSMTMQLNQVTALRSGVENMLASDERNLINTVGGWPCGDGDARNFYNGVRDGVRGQFNNVTDAAQKYGVTAAQTDNSTSLVLGTLLNFQTRYQGVLDKLHNAKISPVGAIQELRLQVAAAAFRDLADYARQQLQ